MQALIKTCALPLAILGLAACGGGGGSKPAPSPVPSSVAASSIAPASSAVSNSVASSVANGSESTQAAVSYPAFSVAKIDNCGVGITAGENTFSLFADYDGNVQNQSLSSLSVSGWNHSNNDNKGRTEWAKLNVNTHATYDFAASAAVNDSCNGVDTINIVLLKKIADWDFQHSNGFERNILAHAYTFGDVKNLVFDVKINSANTRIPSVESLKTTYASYVDGATIDALEDGKVNIGITLGDATNLNGAIIFQLDQTTLSDQWVRVTIPMNKLSLYQEINYNRTAKTLAELSNVLINRILIVGETKSGAVLRGNINPWSTSVPEIFKEMDISFKKIEFQLK